MDTKFRLLVEHGGSVQIKIYGQLTSLNTGSELFFNPNDQSVTRGELLGSLLVFGTETTIDFFFYFDDKNEGLTTFRQLRKAFMNGDYVQLTGDIDDLTSPYLQCPEYQIINLAGLRESSQQDRKVSLMVNASQVGRHVQYEVACVEIIDNKLIGESFHQSFRLGISDQWLTKDPCEEFRSFIGDSTLIVQSLEEAMELRCFDGKEHPFLDLSKLIASFPALEDASTSKAYGYFDIDESLLNVDEGLMSKAELSARLYMAMHLTVTL